MSSDINTLALKCGVSKATISRVFTGRAKVSEAVRARVLAAARELNYRPQQVMARDCIAIVVSDLPHPQRRTSFSEELLSRSVCEITRRKFLAEIIPVAEIGRLYGTYTRAMLLLLSEKGIETHREELAALSIPMVTVNKQFPFCSSVSTDHFEGVRLALEYLHHLGHRRIALALDQADNQAGAERLNAYRTVQKEKKLPFIQPGQFERGMEQELDLLLKAAPTALIVCGEGVALESAFRLRKRGVRIPEDLSLICSELPEISRCLDPEMTTINQDLDRLAAETSDLLQKIVGNHPAPIEHRTLSSTLLVRNSCISVDPGLY